MLAAKKGGGKKKKGGSKAKQSGFAWASNFETTPVENATQRALAELVANTHRTRTGVTLHASVDLATDVPKAVWAAPIAALVLCAEDDGASVCRYANLAACEALGHPTKDGYKAVIDRPIGLAASLGGDDKYESGYTKKVARSDESRIELTDAKRWVLEKAAVQDGKLVSQKLGVAYVFEQWVEETDGFCCRPGGVRTAPELDPAELQASIDSQAAEVRRLKDDGLTNGDPAVKDAVAELLRLKALQEVASA